jgi:lysophospholipase L1-like esterase
MIIMTMRYTYHGRLAVWLLSMSLLLLGCEPKKDGTVPRVVNNNNNMVVATNNTRYLLAMGDSYTIGTGVSVQETFAYQLVQRWRDAQLTVAVPTIIARNGFTTQQLIQEYQQTILRPPYDAVTLLIGVNNQYQGRDTNEYKIQFQWLLQRAIEQAGNRPERVVVLSIPDYSVTPYVPQSDKPRVAAEIDRWNTMIQTLTIARNARFLNITTYSRTAAFDRRLLASDSLHFSGRAYSVWTDSLNRILFPLIKF